MPNLLLRNRTANASKISKITHKRSIFDIDYHRKQTFNASYLTPIMCKRVMPGKSVFINLDTFVRMNTQLVAPFDNLQIETFFFYGADRLVWDNAEYYAGALKDYENPDTDYLMPQVEIPANANIAGSIFNYMTSGRLNKKIKISAIPFRLYNLIYNEYFIDLDCQKRLKVDKGDADSVYTDFELKRIHKNRDYFTNSTRDIQRGAPVTLPLGTTADIIGTGQSFVKILNTDRQEVDVVGNDIGVVDGNRRYVLGAGNGATEGISGNAYVKGALIANLLKADLSNASKAQVSALRFAIRTEEYKEALNRGGGKYTDVMSNIYGVNIPDYKIQRPMYLGGTASPFLTNPIVQTSASTENSPLGEVAGYGTNSDGGRVVNASFDEFGWIIGFVVVKADPQYQQGMDRAWFERDEYDRYNPFYINTSDQPIYREEIYTEDYDATDSDGNLLNKKVFGYIGRYDNDRYYKNEIAGELNSEYQYTLDMYHYAEKFDEAPENNSYFMEDKTNEILDRTMAVRYEDEAQTIKAPQFIGDFGFQGISVDPIPMHANPKTTGLY